MALLLPVKNVKPQFGKNCYLAPNSTVVGDVVMGDDCSVWFNAVIRGDVKQKQQLVIIAASDIMPSFMVAICTIMF